MGKQAKVEGEKQMEASNMKLQAEKRAEESANGWGELKESERNDEEHRRATEEDMLIEKELNEYQAASNVFFQTEMAKMDAKKKQQEKEKKEEEAMSEEEKTMYAQLRKEIKEAMKERNDIMNATIIALRAETAA